MCLLIIHSEKLTTYSQFSCCVGDLELKAQIYTNFSDSKKKDFVTASPLWMSDDVEFWPEPAPKFTNIAALHSELVALSSSGQLYQWKWNETEPYKHTSEVWKGIIFI